MHLSPPAIVYTFFAGLTMALVTRWHHSLWAGFILHMLNNLLVNVIVLTGL
ncbi:CPBP family glutamic-type intramembrane protease [Corynebacterium sp. P4-C1]|uniref:CPBP family glutamic-type intramembrane protease n=1 Tax=Corynebacterium sp. P4-C1 TaxID=3059081 RepID=UPI003463B9EE